LISHPALSFTRGQPIIDKRLLYRSRIRVAYDPIRLARIESFSRPDVKVQQLKRRIPRDGDDVE